LTPFKALSPSSVSAPRVLMPTARFTSLVSRPWFYLPAQPYKAGPSPSPAHQQAPVLAFWRYAVYAESTIFVLDKAKEREGRRRMMILYADKLSRIA
jgi:hypothetical protein